MLSRVTAKNVRDVFFETHCRRYHYVMEVIRAKIYIQDFQKNLDRVLQYCKTRYFPQFCSHLLKN